MGKIMQQKVGFMFYVRREPTALSTAVIVAVKNEGPLYWSYIIQF